MYVYEKIIHISGFNSTRVQVNSIYLSEFKLKHPFYVPNKDYHTVR